jgi:hypothetical protein
LHTWIKELDLESVVCDCAALPDQLVKPLLSNGALTIGIGIRTMAGTWRHAVDRNAEAHRLAVRTWSQDEMQVASVEFIDDAAVFPVEGSMLAPDRPIA